MLLHVRRVLKESELNSDDVNGPTPDPLLMFESQLSMEFSRFGTIGVKPT